MISSIIFIFGGSLTYASILKLTRGEHVSEEENDRRRKISEKNIKNKKQLRDCSW